MPKITAAVCSYNRAQRLPALIRALRAQPCAIDYEILIVENNCTDNTHEVLLGLQQEPGPALRMVNEPRQGISHARNRALEECLDSDYMLFMDDDELPCDRLIQTALDTFATTDALCVGGKVQVDFANLDRPGWLEDNLLGFLAQVDHGQHLFRIEHKKTPVWTANVAYDMRIFRDNPDLRFDIRYNRAGDGVGGGEDVLMFEALLKRGIATYYQPQMSVLHAVDAWKLKRGYFLRLHFVAGKKYGRYEIPELQGPVFGAPWFMVWHFFRHSLLALAMLAANKPGRIRQAMNAAHSLGSIWGKMTPQEKQ